MSFRFAFLTLFLSLAALSKGQAIFLTNNKYLADYTIFITDNEWEADWQILPVTSYYESQRMRGWWYTTKYQYQADFTIYITKYKWEADRLVFITDNKWAVEMGL